MNCSICRYKFEVTEDDKSCKGCPLTISCGMIRCPNCGYEQPAEARLVKILKRWRKK